MKSIIINTDYYCSLKSPELTLVMSIWQPIKWCRLALNLRRYSCTEIILRVCEYESMTAWNVILCCDIASQKQKNNKYNIWRRMSMTISNCDEICRSPTNNSQSKMLYSFPKMTRFSSRKSILYSGFLYRCNKFYDLPSTVTSCRTTSLGFGNKYDFTHE